MYYDILVTKNQFYKISLAELRRYFINICRDFIFCEVNIVFYFEEERENIPELKVAWP